LPADLIGTLVYNPKSGDFTTKKGPIFGNIILADEINRAPAKVQSALLEAMQERQVTIGEETYRLEEPFMVLATQNPVEQKGTFPLPEAQLDRFLLRISMGYPSAADEVEILRRFRAVDPLDEVRPVDVAGELPAAQQEVRDVYVADDVAQYVVALATATREAPGLRLGASPRASLALLHAAQAWAALDGRPFVTPDDVQSLAVPVLAHRVLLSRDAAFAQRDAEAVLREIVAEVPVPAEQGETLSAR